MESITLYYREGSSDKIYQAHLESRNGGWMVTFAYGRRGSTLTTGTKTTTPVSEKEARRIYHQLVTTKKAKGYTEEAEATPYSNGSAQVTDVRPQLLNAVGVDAVPRLLVDEDFLLQPKLDGRRLLLRKRGNEVTGINRRGIECGFPETLREAALAIPGDFLVDGEAVGDVLHVFDLLDWEAKDLHSRPYKSRLVALLHLLAGGRQEHIRWVTTHYGKKKKIELFDQLRKEKAEGVVFKRADASYSAGRPASGGDQLKFKFVETASVVISAINRQRSAGIALWRNTELVSAGNVSIPPNHPIPEIGQVAEVRYLYALPDSGALFQPVYLGVRDDILSAECQVEQLKYKAA